MMSLVPTRWRFAFVFIAGVFAVVGASRVNPQNGLSTSPDGLWEIVDEVAFPDGFSPPTEFVAATLDQEALDKILTTAPRETFADIDPRVQISIPLPTGDFPFVAVARTLMMERTLANVFPEIKTFRFDSVNGPTIAGHLLTGMAKVHATGKAPGGLLRIEPVMTADGLVYLSFFDRNRTDGRNDFEHVLDEQPGNPDDRSGLRNFPPPPPVPQSKGVLDRLLGPAFENAIAPALIETGEQLRIYRFTATTTGEFYQANDTGNGDIDVIFSLLVRLIAVNAVFEPEVGARLSLAANTLDVLFSTPGFPFNNAGTPCSLREANRVVAQILLDPNDYDLGFLFATGGSGGCAWYVVCLDVDNTLHKARGAGDFGADGLSLGTGLLLHEVGHQLGARHTYSGGAAGCNLANFDGDNLNVPSAFAPGSGSTIMSYSGSCGSDNVDLTLIGAGQYYNTKSFEQIAENVFNGDGAMCGSLINTGNLPPTVMAGPNFTIPRQTPFTLSGTGMDDQALTFTWEQFDLAPTQRPIDTDDGSGPIIRSIPPTAFPDRTIPDIRDLLNNVSRAGELLPQVNRNVNFRLAARDNQPGGGGVAFDEMVLTTQGAPFFITSPNSGTFQAGCTVPVTWSIGGGDVAANVDISYSTTGGLDMNGVRQSFPIDIVSGTANDGVFPMPVPCNLTGEARIKVKASDNIFFDVNNQNLNIVNDPPAVILNPIADGEVDEMCEFTVNFTATATDICGVATADVDVDLTKQTPPEYTLGAPTINKAQNGSTQVDVSGSVLVSDLLGSPARLQVMVSAEDNCGATDVASVVVEIADTTPPEVTAALVPVGEVDDDEGRFRVEFSCTDNCNAGPAITASTLNGVPVTNGQIVELELDDDDGQEVEFDDGILSIEAASFELVVVCEDASGNVGEATAMPMFVDEDDDKDDED